jgi:hypothetical protein
MVQANMPFARARPEKRALPATNQADLISEVIGELAISLDLIGIREARSTIPAI